MGKLRLGDAVFPKTPQLQTTGIQTLSFNSLHQIASGSDSRTEQGPECVACLSPPEDVADIPAGIASSCPSTQQSLVAASHPLKYTACLPGFIPWRTELARAQQPALTSHSNWHA